jgi:hypothetical protein
MGGIPRLIAIAFALGSLMHATAWLLLTFGVELYGPGYPAWRHAAFTVADAFIAWVALRHPHRLFFALLAFSIEQLATNGVAAWREWTATRHVEWATVVVIALLVVATVATAAGRRTTGPDDHR